MQNATFTKVTKEKLFDLLKHYPRLGKLMEYEKPNSKNARNMKRQNLKPVKNYRSGFLGLKASSNGIDLFCFSVRMNIKFDQSHHEVSAIEKE